MSQRRNKGGQGRNNRNNRKTTGAGRVGHGGRVPGTAGIHIAPGTADLQTHIAPAHISPTPLTWNNPPSIQSFFQVRVTNREAVTVTNREARGLDHVDATVVKGVVTNENTGNNSFQISKGNNNNTFQILNEPLYRCFCSCHSDPSCHADNTDPEFT